MSAVSATCSSFITSAN